MHINRSVVFLLVLLISCISCGRSKQEKEISFVNTGNKKLQVYTMGKGKNTVVFESGLGVDGTSFIETGIFDSIGRTSQVIAYNRAGMGQSTWVDEKRGLQALANDLDQVIQQKSTHQKVILVGHSLGGAIVRTYAAQHPDKVKALLFIEPNNENFLPYATMSQGNEDTLVATYKKEKITGGAMEAAELIENVNFLKNLPAMPDVPVIVITSTKTDEEMTPEMAQAWVLSHAALGKGLHHFTHIRTDRSGHFIYEEEPALVIENIRKLLE